MWLREQIAEQALDEARRAREQLADDDDRELERDERRHERRRRAGALRELHDAVDDQLADPQRRDRHERANEPEHAPSRP